MAPSWLRPVVGSLLAVGLGLLVASCSLLDRSDQNEAGMELLHQRDGESYPGPRRPVTGTVALQPNGCFRMVVAGRTLLVVWPRRAQQDPQDGALVQLPSGRRLHDGDPVTGTGLEYPVSGLPGVPDGYWGGVVVFCAPDDDTVLVLDEVAAA